MFSASSSGNDFVAAVASVASVEQASERSLAAPSHDIAAAPEDDFIGNTDGAINTNGHTKDEFVSGCILPLRCLVPRSCAFDELSEPVDSQYVFFVRHGQSRWNQAQEAYSLKCMYQEYDHGLSENGWQQALQLRAQIATKRILMASGEVDLKESTWLQRLLKPDFLCSSPFTRAIETAVIGLRDILLDHGELVVLKEAREQKNLGGVDSVGIAIGDEIIPRVKDELKQLYTTSVPDNGLAALLTDFDRFRIDVSDIQEPWWTSIVEREADITERVQTLFWKLRSVGVGTTSIVVGHSHMFRRIFQTYIGDRAQMEQSDMVASLQSNTIPCCGIIGCRLEWDVYNNVTIAELAPVLDTELKASLTAPQEDPGGVASEIT